VLFIVLFPLTAGFAQVPGERWSLESAVKRSEAIVRGSIIDIVYRESESGEGLLVAPHSFVTYQIEKVLRGEVEGDKLTLRFFGGFEPSTGRIMLGPGELMFRVGNRDLLFIAGNGKTFCPLVSCGLGRFRVVDGAVFGNLGLAIRIRDDGHLIFGPDALAGGVVSMVVPPAPDARLRQLRRQVEDPKLSKCERERLKSMIEILSKEQTIGISRRGEPEAPPDIEAASLEAFEDIVQDLSGRYPDRQQAIVSVSPDQTFEVRAPRPRPLPVIGSSARKQAETFEQQRLRRNAGNPVLAPILGGNE
jgi:hypothetical protein